MATTRFRTVDEYLDTLPGDVRAKMETVRRTIRKAVPEAEELLSYRMPAYKFHGRLLYFCAYKNHYSLFGATQGVETAIRAGLSRYKLGKGTIRFPLDEPVPVGLIRSSWSRFGQAQLTGGEVEQGLTA